MSSENSEIQCISERVSSISSKMQASLTFSQPWRSFGSEKPLSRNSPFSFLTSRIPYNYQFLSLSLKIDNISFVMRRIRVMRFNSLSTGRYSGYILSICESIIQWVVCAHIHSHSTICTMKKEREGRDTGDWPLWQRWDWERPMRSWSHDVSRRRGTEDDRAGPWVAAWNELMRDREGRRERTGFTRSNRKQWWRVRV